MRDSGVKRGANPSGERFLLIGFRLSLLAALSLGGTNLSRPSTPSFLLSSLHTTTTTKNDKKKAASDAPPPPKPELVDRVLSDPALLPRGASNRLAARAAAAAAARSPGDTGSPEAQVAALSQRIGALADHLRAHRQDRSSSRGLQAMLARRRKLLQYLRRTDLSAYGEALARHSLKDRYAKLDRLGARAAATAAGAGGGGGGGKGKKKKKK